MRNKSIHSLILFILLFSALGAGSSFSQVHLSGGAFGTDRLTALVLPDNWSLNGDVLLDFSSSKKAKVQEGNAVLVGSKGEPLRLEFVMDTIHLKMDFIYGNNSSCSIALSDGNRIGISSTKGVSATPTVHGLTIPLPQPLRKAGLWQTMEISYYPPAGVINSLTINNVVVLENYVLQDGAQNARFLSFNVLDGLFAIRNVDSSSPSNHKATIKSKRDLTQIPILPAKGEVEMVRSFMLLPGETQKRVKCLSVGTALGRHYAIDLDQGSLIQVWSGSFADRSGISHERATSQLLNHFGSAIDLKPVKSFSLTSLQPDQDSEFAEDMEFLKYRIDDTGFPIVKYMTHGIEVDDQIIAQENGLKRIVRGVGVDRAKLDFKIAIGANIEHVGKDLYRVDGGYYIRLIKASKPLLRSNGIAKELITSFSEDIAYEIIW